MEAKEHLTPRELRKQAYLMGMRLMNTGLDAETIYARLEKQGIPEAMAREVAQGLEKERKRELARKEEPAYHLPFIKVGIGAGVALLSFLIVPEYPIVPMGLMLGGIGAALLAAKNG